ASSIALSYLLAIGVSTLVAFSVTPALGYLLLRDGGKVSSGPLGRFALRTFDSTTGALMSHRRRALAGAAVLAALVAGLLVPQIAGTVRVNTPTDRNLLVRWQASPGTSLEESTRVVTEAAAAVRGISGVDDVGATVGRAVQSDERVNVDASELWIRLASSADYGSTTAAIRQALAGVPGSSSDLMSYQQDRIQNVESDATNNLVVRVYGIDLDTLQRKAEDVRAAISGVAGVRNAAVVGSRTEPTLQVEVNLQAAEKYGLKPGDVRRDATTFFSGLPVGSLYESQAVFDVVVLGDPALRRSTQDVSNMLLDTATGDQVRLGDIADVRLASTPTVIKHDSTSRYVDVVAGVSGNGAGVAQAVASRVRSLAMPLEYHAEVLGNLASDQAANLRELGVVLGVLAGLVLLLQAAFRSLRLAALTVACIVLSAAGALVAAWFTGGLQSLGALGGIMAVLAFAARNLTLLIRDAQTLSASHGSQTAAVTAAARARFAPAALVAAAVGAMMLPLIVAADVPGAEVLHPLGATVLGGLVSTMVVTFLLGPPLLAPFIRPLIRGPDDIEDDEGPAVELVGAASRRVPA
ncbi:MAG TPA: efflux RND transporter permease subunit, partial [Candidatus Dormibacteraeota bacterium]|nr:efflux RND transporter permease subunit [Candidatus Dormibacteraeota bacterium]